jgi:hypothetical protein
MVMTAAPITAEEIPPAAAPMMMPLRLESRSTIREMADSGSVSREAGSLRPPLGRHDGVPVAAASRRDVGGTGASCRVADRVRAGGEGIILIVLGGAVVGSIDNVLRPAILSGRTQLNGLLMFSASCSDRSSRRS